MHAVKGLEFDNVFVIGLEEGIFPHFNSINEGNIEEERRLCYVAITRAKKHLYLLNAKKRMLFGNTQINRPSRFIEEIDSKYIEKEPSKNESKLSHIIKKVKNTVTNTDTNYEVGDLVKHAVFGEGVVVSIDKSIVTIAFAHPHGIKKLMKNHPSITKI